MKAGISVSVAAKPSSDPPRLMRSGTAGQAAMATAGAAPAKGAERGRRGALPTAFPAGCYASGAGCAGPSRPIGGGGAIFGPGMSFLWARSSTRTMAGIGSGFSRAEGVWRRLSPVLRSAVLLLFRGVPPKLCAGSSTHPGTATPRTPPRNTRNRHGHFGSSSPPTPPFPGTSLPPMRGAGESQWRAGGRDRGSAE